MTPVAIIRPMKSSIGWVIKMCVTPPDKSMRHPLSVILFSVKPEGRESAQVMNPHTSALAANQKYQVIAQVG
ncbi:protein of unknown function (plasmid) [Vibrio harveyi]|nr:protein of unknown function [Vibrio harveyi]